MAVNVVAPVIVAALVNGNDAVVVIDAVNERRNLRPHPQSTSWRQMS